jgi:hypothetical protein
MAELNGYEVRFSSYWEYGESFWSYSGAYLPLSMPTSHTRVDLISDVDFVALLGRNVLIAVFGISRHCAQIYKI